MVRWARDVAMHPNSFQSDAAPPARRGRRCGGGGGRSWTAPTDLDLAERDDGEWICLESNDGGASRPAPEQDLTAFWRMLRGLCEENCRP